MATTYPGFIFGISGRYEGGATFAAFNRDIGNAARTAQGAGSRIGSVNRQVADGADRWRALGNAAAIAQGPFSTLGTRFNAISRSLTEMGARLGGTIAALAGGGALLAATSSYQNYTALLKSTTESEREFQAALSQTMDIANRSRTSLEGTIRLYARLKPTLEQQGVGFQQLGRIVETTNKAITLSGASTQEATAAMIQFAQALGSGRLSGEEFRSISEQAQVLRNALAEGIKRGGLIDGFDGSIGALKKLADEQKLTTDVVLQALGIMESEIDARFEKMPVTLSQASSRMSNALLGLVQTFESSTGALNLFARGMVGVADNLDIVAAVAAPLVARFIGIDKAMIALVGTSRMLATSMGLTGASALSQVIALNRLGVSMNAQVTMASRLAVAQLSGSAAAVAWARAQNIATASGSAMAAGLRGLVAILGGPLGIAITAATVGLSYMALQKSVATRAAELMGTTEEALSSKLDATTAALGRQNALLLENARLKKDAASEESQRLTNEARVNAPLAISGAIGFSSNVNRSAAGSVLEDLRKGTINARDALQQLNAAGVTQDNLGTKNYANVLSALTDIDYAEQAARANSTERQRGSLRRTATASSGPDSYGKMTASGIADAKRLADAQTAASEKTRIRAQAEEDYRRIAADVTKTEAERNALIGERRNAENAALAAVDARTKAEREATKAGRAAAAQAKRDAAEQKQQEAQQLRLADSAREAAEGWAAQTEAQRIAERQGDALLKVQKALEGGGITANQADAYKKAINQGAQEALDRPFTEAVTASEAQLAIMDKILAGRESEAEFLSRKAQLEQNGRKLNEEQEKQLRDQIALERQRNREIEDRNRLVDIYANAAGSVQSAGRDFIRGSLDGKFNIGDLASQIQSAFKDTLADYISNSLFGDMESRSREQMTNSMNDLRTAVEANTAAQLGQPAGNGVQGATSRIGVSALGSIGGFAGGALASLASILTKPFEKGAAVQEKAARAQADAAKKQSDNLPANPADAYNKLGDDIAKAFGASGFNIGGAGLGNLLSGAGTGATIAGIGNMLGLGLSSTGASLGGAAGTAFTALTGIPGGEIIGSIAGGLIGKLFQSAKKGSVTISGTNGQISQSAATGNSASRRDAATESADSFSASLQSIADRLGATIGSFSVSLGMRDNVSSVDTTGRGMVSKKYGAVQFDDVEDAIAFALKDAINDGALRGIRESTSRLLKAGNDLETQLDKALSFEDVFRRLRGYTDPVGLAVEDLNREFEGLRDIFEEAGASAEEYADLQKLYDLERAETIIQAQSKISQSLKALIDDLTIGDSGLSLRDREANAQAKVNAYANNSAIKADPEGYAEAARNLLDVQRQLYGSQTAYFDSFNAVIDTAKRVLGSETSVIPAAFSVGEKLDVTPITTGLTTVSSEIVAALADLPTAIAEQIARYMASGTATIDLSAFANRVASY